MYHTNIPIISKPVYCKDCHLSSPSSNKPSKPSLLVTWLPPGMSCSLNKKYRRLQKGRTKKSLCFQEFSCFQGVAGNELSQKLSWMCRCVRSGSRQRHGPQTGKGLVQATGRNVVNITGQGQNRQQEVRGCFV